MRSLTNKLPAILLSCVFPFVALAQQQTAPQERARQSVSTYKKAPRIKEKSMQVGARVGYTNIEKIDGGTMGLGIGFDYAVADDLLLGLTLDHWREDYGMNLYRTVDVRDTIVGAHAKLLLNQFKFNLPITPFGLIGITAHRLTIKESELQPPREGEPRIDQRVDTFSDTEGQLGIDLGAGVLYPINEDVDMSAEIRWRNILEGSVQYDQIAISGGVAYLL